MKSLILLLLISLFTQACLKGTPAERFVNNINSAANKNVVTLVKDPTTRSGYIIVQDGSSFYAIKYSRYNWNSWGVRDRYDAYEYYLRFRFKVTPEGDGYYRGPLGWLYEETNVSGKDLETMGAVSENLKIIDMAKDLEEKFGFSTERSYEVAEITAHWNKLSKSRAMTQKDKDLFSKKLLGVEFNQINEALRSDNIQSYDQVIDKAAEVNGIGLEHMRDLIDQYLLK